LVEKKGGGCTDEYGCWAIFGTTKKMSAADWEFTPILHEKSALTGYKSNGKIPRIFSLTNDDRFFAVFEAVDDGSGGSNPDALAIVVKTRGVATLDHERYLDINGGFLWLAAGAGDRYAILDSTGYSGYNLKTKASYPIAAPSQVLASGTLGAANSFRFGAMSNGGHFVFTAPVDGVLSVLRHDTTKLEVLFKGGDPAPDVPNNPKTDPSGTGQYPLVNAHGYTVFWGKLDTTEPDVTAENASCLWAANAKGEVRLVIREGQPITLPGLGSKTVKTWNLGSGPWRADGLAGVLNDDDRLAVSVTFSDDSVAIVLFHLVH
ncbi:MAG: hypothetical protein KC609_06385, partial [Myxococcales bacterium]|nr:hypothetical protein [Myxococcales bacterium]